MTANPYLDSLTRCAWHGDDTTRPSLPTDEPCPRPVVGTVDVTDHNGDVVLRWPYCARHQTKVLAALGHSL